MALALLVGGWFFVFLLAKGTYRYASVDDASFFRLLLPAAPAFVLLVAAIPLLAPGAGRIVDRARAAVPSAPRRHVAVLAALGLVAFAVYPAAVIASAEKLRGPDARAVVLGSTFVGVDAALAPQASVRGRAVELRWLTAERRERVFYRITRAPGGRPDLTCKRRDDAPDQCEPTGVDVAVVRGGSFVDRPGRGSWTYRVGVVANWLGDATHGDAYVLSPPLVVDVR
jgi:hypothetical protein